MVVLVGEAEIVDGWTVDVSVVSWLEGDVVVVVVVVVLLLIVRRLLSLLAHG